MSFHFMTAFYIFLKVTDKYFKIQLCHIMFYIHGFVNVTFKNIDGNHICHIENEDLHHKGSGSCFDLLKAAVTIPVNMKLFFFHCSVHLLANYCYRYLRMVKLSFCCVSQDAVRKLCRHCKG